MVWGGERQQFPKGSKGIVLWQALHTGEAWSCQLSWLGWGPSTHGVLQTAWVHGELICCCGTEQPDGVTH